jgi:HK97 family phage major capsid protein
MRAVPFNILVPRQTAGVSMQWLGENHVAPVGALTFDQIILEHSKVGGLVVISAELARLSDPSAERLIQADPTAAIADFMDDAFLDPGRAATDISPASITNGATQVASTGSTANAVESDFADLLGAVATGSNMVSPYLIMKPTTALFLAVLRGTNGERVFPNIGATGGDVLGVPVIISANVPSDNDSPSEHIIVALDASEILFADGGVELSVSRQTSLQLTSTPDSPATASIVMTSLWQRNLFAVKAERFVRWTPRRNDAVAVLHGLSVS